MRSRAYRPEAPDCLETRSLSSVAAGLPADPVVVTRHQLNLVARQVRTGFDMYGRYHDLSQVRTEIDEVIVLIPFQRVDGLGQSIDRILIRMRNNYAARVPHAIRTGLLDVIAAIRADVDARVRSGDVVIR
jgi:hypothetical protein